GHLHPFPTRRSSDLAGSAGPDADQTDAQAAARHPLRRRPCRSPAWERLRGRWELQEMPGTRRDAALGLALRRHTQTPKKMGSACGWWAWTMVRKTRASKSRCTVIV